MKIITDINNVVSLINDIIRNKIALIIVIKDENTKLLSVDTILLAKNDTKNIKIKIPIPNNLKPLEVKVVSKY